MRSIFGASVMFGAVYCWSHISHAMDGLDIFADDNHLESFDASEGEDDRHKLWLLMRKLWLPLFFVFTVLVNWDNPFAVITRILLFLLSTKPSPSSIYLFVEKLLTLVSLLQLCHGYMRQKPHFYKYKPAEGLIPIPISKCVGHGRNKESEQCKKLKLPCNNYSACVFFSQALHASKVEVQDYKLLCLAIVEIGDEKIRLIGILGGWWSLPSSLGLYFLAPEQSSSSSL
ncbi:hypothetical protein Godav_022973 [Gossypium davidsonii]|uniref:Uncharacterized protein n=1 Tax=Gossypium davidsonii TaxID=34287 RepID=A0A7J8SQ04_GOSDV|nr:hypothetical protein [Gossypium davidsonii]